jgi:hypothetical protein
MGAGAAMAQELPDGFMPPTSLPSDGHSAHHYGVRGYAQQEASLRAVLNSTGLDAAFLPRSLGAETAQFLVRMFLGGVSAPTDLANQGADAIPVAERASSHGKFR